MRVLFNDMTTLQKGSNNQAIIMKSEDAAVPGNE